MIYNQYKFIFDYKHNNLPKIFTNIWRQNTDFYIENISKPYLDRLPLFQFPRTWNSLSENLKNIESRKLFCKEFFSYLIDEIPAD